MLRNLSTVEAPSGAGIERLASSSAIFASSILFEIRSTRTFSSPASAE
ncbi:hypothetical protein LQ424_26500 [Rhodococcus qingshengii]|nr:hypothetical protein [Rhodococcus qingshengii]MCD2135372.1 hypothetical protein [Rhodococcus qingshengii]